MDEIVPIWEKRRQVFAFQLYVEELLAQDETVIARFIKRGTSVGKFRGQPPTGKSSEVLAIEWFTIKNGQISRRWGVLDSVSHFRQMGLSLWASRHHLNCCENSICNYAFIRQNNKKGFVNFLKDLTKSHNY